MDTIEERLMREGIRFTCPLEFSAPTKVKAAATRPKPAARTVTRPPRYATPRTAAERWDEAIAVKMDAGMSRGEAIRAVVYEDPELHAAWRESLKS